MTILAIETSCDETSVAVIKDGKILSNVVWSQIELHSKWGGVVPSIAKRAHQEKIDDVLDEALEKARIEKTDFVAVTVGPGLAIALEVGIAKAKEIAKKWGVPVVAVNHIEGHILSALRQDISFPALGLVVSGGHTEMIEIKKIGDYKILGATADDALGEALDKAARMLGLGYPGGAKIERLAKRGDENKYRFTLPYLGRESEGKFSYSGLKSALWRLTDKIREETGELNQEQIADLASSFQKVCFDHLTRVMERSLSEKLDGKTKSLLVGGGVIFNENLRSRLEETGRRLGLKVYFPEKRMCGDNAGMIGLAGYFRALRGDVIELDRLDALDRIPRWRVDEKLKLRV